MSEMPHARELRGLGPSKAQIRAQREAEEQRAAQARRAREEEMGRQQDAERSEIASLYNQAMRQAAFAARDAARQGNQQASIEVDSLSMVGGTGDEAARLVAGKLREKGYRRVRVRIEKYATGDPDTDDRTVLVDFSW